MVTKHHHIQALSYQGLILAKNHMVTKRVSVSLQGGGCLILAKNHMVTKQYQHLIVR